MLQQLNTSTSNMTSPSTSTKLPIVLRAFRALQVTLGLNILILSASLLTRWSSLQSHCLDAEDCSKLASGVGGLKYCVFVGVWVLLDAAIYAINTHVTAVPMVMIDLYWAVYRWFQFSWRMRRPYHDSVLVRIG